MGLIPMASITLQMLPRSVLPHPSHWLFQSPQVLQLPTLQSIPLAWVHTLGRMGYSSATPLNRKCLMSDTLTTNGEGGFLSAPPSPNLLWWILHSWLGQAFFWEFAQHVMKKVFLFFSWRRFTALIPSSSHHHWTVITNCQQKCLVACNVRWTLHRRQAFFFKIIHEGCLAFCLTPVPVNANDGAPCCQQQKKLMSIRNTCSKQGSPTERLWELLEWNSVGNLGSFFTVRTEFWTVRL